MWWIGSAVVVLEDVKVLRSRQYIWKYIKSWESANLFVIIDDRYRYHHSNVVVVYGGHST